MSEGARERGEHTVVLVFAEHDLDRIDVGCVDLTRRIAQGAATHNGDKVLERHLQVHPLPKQISTRTYTLTQHTPHAYSTHGAPNRQRSFRALRYCLILVDNSTTNTNNSVTIITIIPRTAHTAACLSGQITMIVIVKHYENNSNR
jgi:hypothetical protein